ncbi:MAG: hypothetical protein AB8B83_06070 [Bdellovibrionales bacterium]
MIFKSYCLIILLCFVSFDAYAAQPISVSLAECSVIYGVTSITAEEKGKPEEQINAMRRMSEVFEDASYEQAEAEGQSDGKAFIESRMQGLVDKWHERWLSDDHVKALSLMKENMEWVGYCGALGKDRGLLPLKR